MGVVPDPGLTRLETNQETTTSNRIETVICRSEKQPLVKTVCVIGPLSQSKTMAKKSLYNAL